MKQTKSRVSIFPAKIMEKLIQRENAHVKSPDSSDLDFNDVFGGPPRRFSMQEVRERYSFGNSEEETVSPPWGALKEKPVFGEETTPRRRRKGTDFFDDIFKGGDSDRDRDSVFGSNPSSRIMSPKADHLGTSLPTSHFSLPAKSAKGVDFPTFGSHNHGQYKVEGGGNGVSSPQSWSGLSRFSNEAARGTDEEKRNEVRPVDDQFHFSIYKWAGKGVPMLMPLVIGNNLKSNMKHDKSSSFSERVQSKSTSVRKRVSPVESKEVQVKSVDERSEGDRITINKSQGKPLHAYLVEADQPGDTDSKKGKEKGSKGVESTNAAAKGKVKEFVQIFNQEGDVKGSQSSRLGNVGIEQKEVSNPAKVKQEANNLHTEAKKPDASFKVVEDLKKDESHAQKGVPPTRKSSHTRTRSSLRRSFSAGTIRKDMKMSPENLDDPLEDNFVVEELHDDHETVEGSDDTKAIDAKIRQWSIGKKGNIRSLLSTLQYVLWQESGWKPVPLVDLIETNSVKRAYQKALLRLHPDKLQQKGAAFHHKYTAEKVFDILQEAWDHFNTCSSLGI